MSTRLATHSNGQGCYTLNCSKWTVYESQRNEYAEWGKSEIANKALEILLNQNDKLKTLSLIHDLETITNGLINSKDFTLGDRAFVLGTLAEAFSLTTVLSKNFIAGLLNDAHSIPDTFQASSYLARLGEKLFAASGPDKTWRVNQGKKLFNVLADEVSDPNLSVLIAYHKFHDLKTAASTSGLINKQDVRTRLAQLELYIRTLDFNAELQPAGQITNQDCLVLRDHYQKWVTAVLSNNAKNKDILKSKLDYDAACVQLLRDYIPIELDANGSSKQRNLANFFGVMNLSSSQNITGVSSGGFNNGPFLSFEDKQMLTIWGIVLHAEFFSKPHYANIMYGQFQHHSTFDPYEQERLRAALQNHLEQDYSAAMHKVFTTIERHSRRTIVNHPNGLAYSHKSGYAVLNDLLIELNKLNIKQKEVQYAKLVCTSKNGLNLRNNSAHLFDDDVENYVNSALLLQLAFMLGSK